METQQQQPVSLKGCGKVNVRYSIAERRYYIEGETEHRESMDALQRAHDSNPRHYEDFGDRVAVEFKDGVTMVGTVRDLWYKGSATGYYYAAGFVIECDRDSPARSAPQDS